MYITLQTTIKIGSAERCLQAQINWDTTIEDIVGFAADWGYKTPLEYFEDNCPYDDSEDEVEDRRRFLDSVKDALLTHNIYRLEMLIRIECENETEFETYLCHMHQDEIHHQILDSIFDKIEQ